MILTTITLLIQLLPGLLQSVGVISPAMGSLIGQLSGALPTLISSLAKGGSVPADVITILTAFKAEIAALKAANELTPHALGLADTLTFSLSNALAAYQKAATIDDPSTLTDLPTNLTAATPAVATVPAAPTAAAIAAQLAQVAAEDEAAAKALAETAYLASEKAAYEGGTADTPSRIYAAQESALATAAAQKAATSKAAAEAAALKAQAISS